MRSFLVFAAIIAALGIYTARQLDKTAAAAHSPYAAVAAQESPAPSSGGDVVLSSGRDGHFYTAARVEGRHLEFIVDTGATMVALTATSAAQLGIHPTAREFTMRSHTANGVIAVAPVRLRMVEIGDITVYDVSAVIFPDQALSQNLLGMSFLSRLRRYQYENGKLVLER
jgi:aspartyl protease family protein